jgi:hypothetical protein
MCNLAPLTKSQIEMFQEIASLSLSPSVKKMNKEKVGMGSPPLLSS